MGSHLLFLLNLASTWFLVGLIWLVQIVVYPQFLRVPADSFQAYHQAHMRAITYVVAPAMLVELVTSALLLFKPPISLPMWIFWVGASCVAVCWASTMLVQVPLHNSLAGGFTTESADKLTATNWVRTIAWSVHGLVLMYAYLKIGSAAHAFA